LTRSAAARGPGAPFARCRSADRSAPISRGACSTPPFDYEAFTAADGLIGHGGIVVFDDTVDMAKQARFAMEFCAIESCGKCTPCRIGSARGVELVDKIVADENRAENITVLEDLCNTMKFGSLCALGGFTPYPVMSALTHFPEDFGASPKRLEAAE
jgi:formate dehydrogenase iron-sulfur subunit